MNMKQLKGRVRASAFSHRKLNQTVLVMEQSFQTVKKNLANPEQKKK